jgi:RNA polymerase sigma-70 factor, ECF subfamily
MATSESNDREWDNADHDLSRLVNEARGGDSHARNDLFQQLRTYLLVVANDHLDSRLQAKLGPSDIVQQSMLRAVEQLDNYRGDTAAEFKGWLRQILVNETKLARRGFAADKRNIGREVSLTPPTENSAENKKYDPIDAQLTPRANFLADEQTALVRQVIDRLPEQLQTVIKLRNREELSFEEIGQRMNMSTSGCAKLWYRALVEFQKLYQQQNESRII